MTIQRTLPPQLRFAFGLLGAAMMTAVPAAFAGGTPENMLVIIDPTNADSLYIGNYYKNARDIPDANVIYMAPGASNYTTFVEKNLPALFGSLANQGIEDHIDYIVVMPGAPFYVYAPGLISDECYSFSRFSISSVYTMAFIADEILTGDLTAVESNRFYPFTDNAWGFDSSYAWLLGTPSTWPNARRYFIGALLGYTGENGNTLEEIIALIDRAVAVDDTRPGGAFYFMNNTADTARNVRHVQYATGMAALAAIGGPSQQIFDVLPFGHHDCLGIMTGAASLAISSGDFTVVPGAFCDHLTSYAAQFDTGSQTKVTAWINKGACGSWGAVHEPCNYQGKFPHARVHRYYYEGSSLGEAAFRSVEYTPFQMLLYGDPMTRPWAHLPVVDVADAPTEPVSGTITLTPTATTTHPTADVFFFHLHIDGVFMDQIEPGETFSVDTTELTDGWHDLRVLAYEGTLVASVGRWVGSFIVDNCGCSVTLDVTPSSGDQATSFIFDVAALGGTPLEVRVVQNGRVVAASPGSVATLTT